MKKLIKIIKIIRSWVLWHLCFGQKRKHYEKKCKNLLEKVFPDDFNFVFLTQKTDMYVLTYHSGEIFIFLELLRSAKNYQEHVKNSLLIATKPYHIDLIEMVCPEMEYVFIPQAHKMIDQKQDVLTYKHKNLRIIFLQEFDTKYHHVMDDYTSKICYAQMLLDVIKLDFNLLNKPKIVFDDKSQQNLMHKKAQIELGDKFVFIAPEAVTLTNLPARFWNHVCDKLHQKGYDCFFNLVDENPEFKNIKTFPLSMKEANLLARHASGIIAIRSGFTEQLAIIDNIPKVILYNDRPAYSHFTSVPANRCLEFYTLKKYPFIADNIYEFDASNADEKLADKIVQIITQERN